MKWEGKEKEKKGKERKGGKSLIVGKKGGGEGDMMW